MRENKDSPQHQALFKRLEQVTAQQIWDFFDAQDVTSICLMCKADGSQILDVTEHRTGVELFSVPEKPGNTFPTYYHNTPLTPGDKDLNYYYKFTCAKCGFITMHSIAPILHWIDQTNTSDKASEGAKNV